MQLCMDVLILLSFWELLARYNKYTPALVFVSEVQVRRFSENISCSLQAVRVEHCERVHVIAATKRICIANCRECVFFLGVNQRPLIVGDNYKLQVMCLSKAEGLIYKFYIVLHRQLFLL